MKKYGCAKLAVALRTNSALAVLDLGSNILGDDGVGHLVHVLPTIRLKLLDLRDNGIGDDGAALLSSALATHESLTTLLLVDNDISDPGAIALSQMLVSPLLLLHALFGIFTAACLLFIRSSILQCPQRTNSVLTKLSLRENNIEDDGVTELAYALTPPEQPESGTIASPLLSLDLMYNKFTDTSAQLFVNALDTNFTLCELPFRTDRVSQSMRDLLDDKLLRNGVEPVCMRVAANDPDLTSLDLARRQIGITSGSRLSPALAYNGTLVSIDMQHNHLGEEGGLRLVDALASAAREKRSKLRSLNLASNKIGPRCSRSLQTLLGLNGCMLRSLWLQDNNFGDEGAVAMGAGIDANGKRGTGSSENANTQDVSDNALIMQKRALLELSLASNGIDTEGAVALERAMRTNLFVKKLDMQCNQIAPSSRAALNDSLCRNRMQLTVSRLQQNDQALTSLNLSAQVPACHCPPCCDTFLRRNLLILLSLLYYYVIIIIIIIIINYYYY
jgi:Ran GTPase-activating protein (RanGAP) involved in mRNA processing and transport